jgi:hypothetical protein
MTTNDEARSREERALLLEFEMHKHFTTVLAALGVVLLTIIPAFFAAGKQGYSWLENFFLITCFVVLGVGGVCSILAMQSIFQQIRHPCPVPVQHWSLRHARKLPPGATLILGIALFCGFVYIRMQR